MNETLWKTFSVFSPFFWSFVINKQVLICWSDSTKVAWFEFFVSNSKFIKLEIVAKGHEIYLKTALTLNLFESIVNKIEALGTFTTRINCVQGSKYSLFFSPCAHFITYANNIPHQLSSRVDRLFICSVIR